MKRIAAILLALALALSLNLSALAVGSGVLIESASSVGSAQSGVVIGGNFGDIMVTTGMDDDSVLSDSINSFCGLGDTLYMLSYDMLTVYAQKVGEDQPTKYALNLNREADDEGNSYSVGYLVSNGEALYLLFLLTDYSQDESQYTAELFSLSLDGEAFEAESVGILDLDAITDTGSYFGIEQVQGLQNYLVFTFYNDSGDNPVALVSLEDASVSLIDEENIRSVSLLSGNELLVQIYDWNNSEAGTTVARYDVETKTLTELCSIQLENYATLQNLCYDAETETAYCVRAGEIYPIDLDSGEFGEPVTDVTGDMFSSTSPVILEGGYFAFVDYHSYIIRSLHPEATDKRKLRVYDTTWSNSVQNAYLSFTKDHSDATAIVSHDYLGNVTDSMMNRDGSVDVLIMNTAMEGYDALVQRGYMADFSASEALNQLLERVRPSLREEMKVNGEFAILPVEYYIMQMRFKLDALEEIGITKEDLPHNWMDFMDWLKSLEDVLPDDGSAHLIDPWYSDQEARSALMTQVFMTYQLALTYAPEYARTEDMIEIFQKLESIDFIKLGCPTQEEVYSDDYEPEYDWSKILVEWNVGSQLGGITKERYYPVIMSLTQDAPAFLSIDCSVAFINPYSENQDLALAFIEALSENLEPEIQYILFEDMDEPLLNSYHDEAVQNMEEYLEMLRAEYEDADEADKQELAENITEYEGYLEEIREDIWEISQDDIAWVNENGQNLKFAVRNWLYSNDNGEAWELIEQYASGQLDAERLMKEIDRKIRMMILENS